jgi:hypothetical protein
MALALAAGALCAEEKSQSKTDSEPDFSKVISAMKSKIDLSDEQESRVSLLFREYVEKRKSVMEQYPGDDDDDILSRRIEIRRLNHEAESEIEKLLGEDQLETYRAIAREHMAPRRGGERNKASGERIEEMIQRLDLDDEKAGKVRPILEGQAERIRLMMGDRGTTGGGGGERPDMRKMEKIRKEMDDIESDTEKKLEKVLDSEQMKEYREIVRERREKMREKRRAPGDPGGPGRP